jgi:hypothetical protein
MATSEVRNPKSIQFNDERRTSNVDPQEPRTERTRKVSGVRPNPLASRIRFVRGSSMKHRFIAQGCSEAAGVVARLFFVRLREIPAA